MKKTYYEILEIDKNASPEIVKKAYTTLAKKYHPDLQKGNLKQNYEEKLKLINKAYEVISNKEKREKYDLELQEEQIRQAQQKACHNTYVQNLKNRGYKIRYKKTPKEILKNFIALALTVLILFLLWQLPFVRNLFKDNILIQTIMNIFK